MKHWLINSIYLSAYTLLAPWILWRQVARRSSFPDWRQRWFGFVPNRSNERPCVWFHAVSVGEVNQLETLLKPVRDHLPDHDIVISATTRTGLELAKKKHPQFMSFCFPIDFSWAMQNAIRRISPSLIVLTELELWPNLISYAKKHGVPLAVINARLSEKSFRGYRRFNPLTAAMFRQLDLVAAQTDAYAHRFTQLGTAPERVFVTGNIKFDSVSAMPARENPDLATWANLCQGDSLLVAGSTQEPEESIVAQVYLKLRQKYPQLRLVVVPRHPHRARSIATGLNQVGLNVALRTRMTASPVDRNSVILVDQIGELNYWWHLAAVAFVGGSMGSRGGQNMIEPAAAGAPVCFGPNTWNFRQVVRLMLEHDVATVVTGVDDLEQFVRRCLDEQNWAQQRAARARQLVLSQRGAAVKTAELLAGLSQGAINNHREAA